MLLAPSHIATGEKLSLRKPPINGPTPAARGQLKLKIPMYLARIEVSAMAAVNVSAVGISRSSPTVVIIMLSANEARLEPMATVPNRQYRRAQPQP